MKKLEIEYKEAKDIKPYKNNPRIHSREQIESIKQSIQKLGNRKPIEIDENNVIICGHGRYEVYKELKINPIPVIVHSDMTESQKKAYRIADNELALRSSWDMAALTIEIKEIDLKTFGIESLENYQIQIELIDNDSKLSGAQYGDTASKTTVPVNIIGIGGLVNRSVMEEIKTKLIELGAIEQEDNSKLLNMFFIKALNAI